MKKKITSGPGVKQRCSMGPQMQASPVRGPMMPARNTMTLKEGGMGITC